MLHAHYDIWLHVSMGHMSYTHMDMHTMTNCFNRSHSRSRLQTRGHTDTGSASLFLVSKRVRKPFGKQHQPHWPAHPPTHPKSATPRL